MKTTKIKLEYIWLDGNKDEPNLRSKTKVVDVKELDGWHGDAVTGAVPNTTSLPMWGFDGSSTEQAEGNYSDCLLLPVKVVPDPYRHKGEGFLVMCEVLDADTEEAHESNQRAKIEEYVDGDLWFGFEQEYFFMNPETGRPLGFPKQGYPAPQGKYYCGVGNVNVKSRNIVEKHMDLCIEAGLNITGVNGEVAIGQWEYQIFGKGEKDAADSLWLSRYLLQRLGEQFGVNVEFHPKPEQGDWNGSGMHTNFSSRRMRDSSIGIGSDLFDILADRHVYHIENYGAYNELRLTGLHETQHIEQFSYGVSDRGASIRIPQSTENNGGVGYLEDRRPASNADPYRVVRVLSTAIKMAEDKEREMGG